MEISKINDFLYVSGDLVYSPSPTADFETLEGVDIIFDLREESDDSWEVFRKRLAGTEFRRVRMYDDSYHDNTSDMFFKVLEEIYDYSENREIPPEEVKVFLHCHMGINRSPSMAMFLLMVIHDMEPINAHTLIRQQRPISGLAYAAEAVYAKTLLETKGYQTLEARSAMITWKKYDKAYWTRSKIAKINKYIDSCRGQYNTYLDAGGMIHATAKGKDDEMTAD